MTDTNRQETTMTQTLMTLPRRALPYVCARLTRDGDVWMVSTEFPAEGTRDCVDLRDIGSAEYADWLAQQCAAVTGLPFEVREDVRGSLDNEYAVHTVYSVVEVRS